MQRAISSVRLRLLSASAQQTSAKYQRAVDGETEDMLLRSGDPCGAIAQAEGSASPAAAESAMPEDASSSQEPGRRPSGRLEFALWTLAHYMRRPEPERALFWQHAPWGVRLTISHEIEMLPDTHATRVQAMQRN